MQHPLAPNVGLFVKSHSYLDNETASNVNLFTCVVLPLLQYPAQKYCEFENFSHSFSIVLVSYCGHHLTPSVASNVIFSLPLSTKS